MLIDPFRCLGGDLDSVDSTPKYIADEDMGARGLKRDAIGATHDLRRAVQISRIRKFTKRPARSIGANKAEAVDLVSHNQSAVRQHHPSSGRVSERSAGRIISGMKDLCGNTAVLGSTEAQLARMRAVLTRIVGISFFIVSPPHDLPRLLLHNARFHARRASGVAWKVLFGSRIGLTSASCFR